MTTSEIRRKCLTKRQLKIFNNEQLIATKASLVAIRRASNLLTFLNYQLVKHDQ